jgi:N-acetylglutamate synthase-like GNAT family acetyltransferase
MGHNQTPHIGTHQEHLRCGGSLKDGWSYLMPNDEFILDQEVSVAFADELESHVIEQTEALKALYLSSRETDNLHADSDLSIEEEVDKNHIKHFIVKRGLQVVGVATYSDRTGRLTDVAVRPSAGQHQVSETLFKAVKEYTRNKLGRSGSLIVLPRSQESRALFEKLGFHELDDEQEDMHLEIRD